jgi:hypothetical protein
VEVAEHDELVVAAGLGRDDVDVLVEELLAAGELADVLVALEAAAARRAAPPTAPRPCRAASGRC